MRTGSRDDPPAAALLVFGRPPVPGQAKTRLSGELGAERAARLYAAFLEDTLAMCKAQPRCRVSLWVAGEPEHPRLLGVRGSLEVTRRSQPGGQLGRRLWHAITDSLRSHQSVLALGSDAPSLPAAYVGHARRALEHASVVIGPALDGGYWLLGVRGQPPPWSELECPVRWSTRHALGDTLRCCQREGRSVAVLSPWYDVDTPGDLELLRLQLRLRPELAPATARALGLPS